jgi:hypothetical protein
MCGVYANCWGSASARPPDTICHGQHTCNAASRRINPAAPHVALPGTLHARPAAVTGAGACVYYCSCMTRHITHRQRRVTPAQMPLTQHTPAINRGSLTAPDVCTSHTAGMQMLAMQRTAAQAAARMQAATVPRHYPYFTEHTTHSKLVRASCSRVSFVEAGAQLHMPVSSVPVHSVQPQPTGTQRPQRTALSPCAGWPRGPARNCLLRRHTVARGRHSVTYRRLPYTSAVAGSTPVVAPLTPAMFA